MSFTFDFGHDPDEVRVTCTECDWWAQSVGYDRIYPLVLGHARLCAGPDGPSVNEPANPAWGASLGSPWTWETAPTPVVDTNVVVTKVTSTADTYSFTGEAVRSRTEVTLTDRTGRVGPVEIDRWQGAPPRVGERFRIAITPDPVRLDLPEDPI